MPEDRIQVHDLVFKPYLAEREIRDRVRLLGMRINRDYEGKNPIFLAVLNGAFMFAADLFREVVISCEISFVKVASYKGTESSGAVKELLGLNEALQGRHVVVVEDIVDSGLTMRALLDRLSAKNPASVRIASLLLKPERLQESISVDYLGFKVPDKFLLGYGLDYNGQGRNLCSIYEPVGGDEASSSAPAEAS